MVEQHHFTLWRGPLLVGTILLSLLYPYILQLSLQMLFYIACLSIGLVLTLQDFARYVQQAARRRLIQRLDSIVLDNVLRFIFDPQIGLIATVVSCFLGNASMYALPMSTEERVRLLNSCLWTTPQHAHVILTQPGGVKQVLPEFLQNWLKEGEKRDDDNKVTDKTLPSISDIIKEVVSDDESSDQASEDMGCASPETPTRERDQLLREDRNRLPTGIRFPGPEVAIGRTGCIPSSKPFESTTLREAHAVQKEDPLLVLTSIVKHLIWQSTKRWLPSSLPATVSPALGTTITAILLISRLRKGLRHTLTGVAAVATLATLWSKNTQSMNLSGTILGSSAGVSNVFARCSLLLQKISGPQGRKWKAAIAFFILWYVRRLQRRTPLGTGRKYARFRVA